tara:strand:+ start:438 stop:674 length:237 start_codon:yes stop_codon:yes gene_type:complete
MKTNKDKSSPYYTDKEVKAEIDIILQQNSVIWSNLGTGSNEDSKTRKEGEKKWKALSNKIKSLDGEFYKVICPYGIDS